VAEYLGTLGAEIRDIKEVVANGYLRLCVKQINIKVTQMCQKNPGLGHKNFIVDVLFI